MTYQAYPSWLLYIISFLVMLFLFKYPYRSFLIVVFVYSAENLHAAVQTRTSFLGPFLNLNDVLQLTCLLALFTGVAREKRPICVPPQVAALVSVWVIASANVLLRGMRYEILREIRYMSYFPIQFLIAANMGIGEKRAKQLLQVMLLGSGLGAVQHIMISLGQEAALGEAFGSAAQIRTIAYNQDLSKFIVLLLYYNSRILKIYLFNRIIIVILFSLYICSLLLSQTRSIYISFSITYIIVAMLYFKIKFLIKSILFVFIILLFVNTSLSLIGSRINLYQIVTERFGTFGHDDASARGTATRENALRAELQEWRKGNVFLGRGVGYHWLVGEEAVRMYGGEEGVAWGHLGYVTYLARLGLFGLFIYGIYLPISILVNSINLYIKSENNFYIRLISICSILFILIDSITFFMSSSYIQISLIAPIVFGAMWSAKLGMATRKHGIGTKWQQSATLDYCVE